jgi:FdhE protein
LEPWARRIARARHLASQYPVAAEVLEFYVRLAEYQQTLFEAGGTTKAGPSGGSFVTLLDRECVLDEVPGFLSWLSRSGPPALAAFALAAAGRFEERAPEWRRLLDARLDAPASQNARLMDEHAVFVIDALLQPLLELAAWGMPPQQMSVRQPARCPICSDLPVVGVLREEGQGARRRLLCARCLHEWNYLRLVCPACAEDRFDALPVYTAEQWAHVRIEACQTCHQYLKTIDATKDGLAVPQVDDLASVPLDLWAREHGYSRLRANLLRT